MISIFLPDFRGGGAERVNIDLAKEFAAAGYDVEFLVLSADGEFLAEVSKNFSVIDLRCSRVRSALTKLARYLRNRRPDALIASMWPLTVIAPIARLISGHNCKLLVSEHNMLSVQYRGWGRLHRSLMRLSMALAYRMVDVRVGVSNGVVEDTARLSMLPSNRLSAVLNPVPLRPGADAVSLARAEQLWKGPKGSRILTVGSLKPQKNHSLLLRAFSQLELVDASLMIVGAGPDRNKLQSLARDLGISERVVFSGFQSDTTAFYETADLFVLSSDYEGFGNVLVEALSFGLSVVSTDCPSGPFEILAGGVYGRLVPVSDVSAMVDAIKLGLVERRDPANLKARANDFLPQFAAKRYLDLLDMSVKKDD